MAIYAIACPCHGPNIFARDVELRIYRFVLAIDLPSTHPQHQCTYLPSS
jgi:hypothetical protein